jgi:hypothetical protein
MAIQLTPIGSRVSEINVNTPLNLTITYPANYPNAKPAIQLRFSLGPTVTVDIRRLRDSVKNRYESSHSNQLRIRLNASVANAFH